MPTCTNAIRGVVYAARNLDLWAQRECCPDSSLIRWRDSMDKGIKKSLQQYAQVFLDGQQQNINEADTVMYLTKFFTDVLGYDLFSEITKEFQIKDKYCDIAIKVHGQVKFL